MQFIHYDHNEQYISLHDCIAEQAYLTEGKLCFTFADGFWISPEHPESDLDKMVRTDFSKVEYTLTDGKEYDVTVYVFQHSFSGEIAGREWELAELIDAINAGTHKLEFLYQYLEYSSRIVECELISVSEPYRQTCILKISAPKVRYYWNNLRADRPW